MKALEITLTAREPLVITSGSAESMAHECLGYIPGNMLLGAMAGIWKRKHPGQAPDDNADFRRVFLEGQVLWGHALPLCASDPSVPVPLAYRRVKNHDALPVCGEKGGKAGGENLVFNLLALKDNENLQDLWKKVHPDSKERIKTKKLSAGFMDPQTLHLAPEKRVWNIHVALGEQRSALEGQLFGYSALACGSRLLSLLLCRNEEAARSLEDLFGNVKSISVGHARSAGYGAVDIETAWREAEAEKSERKEEFNLFLHSQYMPLPSWADPLENLRCQLERLTGQEPEIVKNFSAFGEIQGYNGLWNRPRDSRLCLEMGAAFKLKFPVPVSLPRHFYLGADQREGYGHIECDPAFLNDSLPEIAPLAAKCEKAGQPETLRTSPESSPLWRLLRERAAERQAEIYAREWLFSEPWRKFLEDAEKLSRPTSSQRNSLRNISLAEFRAMLDKTPGAQWKQAVCYSPFIQMNDSLDQIMLTLLDPPGFAEKFKCAAPLLPGKAASEEEMELIQEKARRLFVRELVARWGKLSAISGKE